MAITQVNGDVSSSGPQSAFLQHLLNYPVIHDGVHTFKTNELGQRSIKLGDSAYKTFAAPVIPWFAKPLQYVAPYAHRVDDFGDKTLDRIDERFPVVKKPTNDLYNETKGLILLPYHKGLEGKDHIFQIYSSEYKKADQQGLVAQGKAAVTTCLVVSNETLTWLSSYFNAKKDESSQAVHDKINQ